ncbi:hypothetical protein J2S13_003156 [Oikeobacillus pervagus]|uniref:Knr4/Smi1-like domain-containing protein n=1 Tax=Oikeobacillus pervagus TaxID=1325931 RepID=A0AAJ1T4M7_9BACI|nr:hypothetical protein [Oikeobacillus pervagus]
MIKSIWKEHDEHKLKPITKETVAIVEKKLKVKLPESYISLLKEQNGGYIIFDSYPTDFPTSWADDHIYIDHIRGIGEEGGILESDYLIKEWGLPKEVVLISGDGHTWIAFDYRNTNKEPPVILIENDGEEIIELAPNFETFLNGLTNWEGSDSIEMCETDEIQEKYFKGEISDEQMKRIISEQTRNRRTNASSLFKVS